MKQDKDPFARFIKRQDHINYPALKVWPQAFILKIRNGKMERGISVVSLKDFPGNYWDIATKYVGSKKVPVLGYAELMAHHINSCEIPLQLEEAPSKNIPNHYEIRPLLEKIDALKVATQLAEKAKFIPAP